MFNIPTLTSDKSNKTDLFVHYWKKVGIKSKTISIHPQYNGFVYFDFAVLIIAF